jgi:hypothetical protein
MNKIILLAITALTLYGCNTIEYEGSTKIIFEGRVTDQNGNPLEGIPVEAEYDDGSVRDIAGIGETNANGEYFIMFPGAREDVSIELQINRQYQNYSSLSNTTYVNLTRNVLKADNYQINFEPVKLYPINNSVILELNFVGSGTGRSILKYDVLGMVSENYIDYNFQNIPTDTPMNFEAYYDYYPYGTISVAKNQVLTVKYMLSDFSVYEVEVPVGEESLEYTISY